MEIKSRIPKSRVDSSNLMTDLALRGAIFPDSLRLLSGKHRTAYVPIHLT